MSFEERLQALQNAARSAVASLDARGVRRHASFYVLTDEDDTSSTVDEFARSRRNMDVWYLSTTVTSVSHNPMTMEPEKTYSPLMLSAEGEIIGMSMVVAKEVHPIGPTRPTMVAWVHSVVTHAVALDAQLIAGVLRDLRSITQGQAVSA